MVAAFVLTTPSPSALMLPLPASTWDTAVTAIAIEVTVTATVITATGTVATGTTAAATVTRTATLTAGTVIGVTAAAPLLARGTRPSLATTGAGGATPGALLLEAPPTPGTMTHLPLLPITAILAGKGFVTALRSFLLAPILLFTFLFLNLCISDRSLRFHYADAVRRSEGQLFIGPSRQALSTLSSTKHAFRLFHWTPCPAPLLSK